ncbi:putative transcription regulator with HTH domain-containing protein [Endozoicomonas montiporae CL-33]|nr:putative transcription regulator with HTH domain-containing protein [Endozoicomonas montiporae CL-33]
MSAIKVIKTEQDYADAMDRLMTLMESAPEEDSPEDSELEVLALLIEKYETEQFPTDLPDPIEAIRFRMDQQGLTQKDMKPYFGSASKVSEVLNGKRDLSLTMIRKLHDGLGIPADVLIQERGASLPDSDGILWDHFPLAEMKKRGCFPDFTGSINELKVYSEEYLRRFLGSVHSSCIQPALCRSSAHYVSDKEVDPYALLAWQVRILQKAEKIKTNSRYEPCSINPAVMKALAKLSWSSQAPKLAEEFLSNLGIKLVTEPHFEKTYLDGAVMLDSNNQPVIGLTLRHDRLDNFWFTLLHEVAHVALHLNSDATTFFDDIDSSEKDDTEHEADRAAAEALIDSSAWSTAKVRESKSERDCIALAKELQISPAIIAGRLRHENKNYSLLTNMIGNKTVRLHFPD